MQFPHRTAKDHLKLVIKGMGMGAADVVPGVSGGTIALITGIYDEFLCSLKQLSPKTLWVLKDQGLKAAWQSVNGGFLLSVFVGILLSAITFAHIITWALEAYPILVWAFFFGLVLASIVVFCLRQKQWRSHECVGLIIGAMCVYGVSIVTPAQLPINYWVLFGGGFIAICAMILPGVSGSFLLLLMGLYPGVLAAVKGFDIPALASFGVGCMAGLLVFSHFLSWLLSRYYSVTMAVLIGFLIGSLNVIWPWKLTLQTVVDRHGEVVPLLQEAVMPWAYAAKTGAKPMILMALTAVVLGLFIVLFTEFVSRKNSFKG